MFCSHKKTDILIGMAAGLAVGALAATCTCIGTDRKKMKKIKIFILEIVFLNLQKMAIIRSSFVL